MKWADRIPPVSRRSVGESASRATAADHDLSTTFASTGTGRQAINDADASLKRLDAVMFDPGRRAAAVADIKARWP
jgi:hypothetical protein